MSENEYKTIDKIGYGNTTKYYVVDNKIVKIPKELEVEVATVHMLSCCYYVVVNNIEYRIVNTIPNLQSFVHRYVMYIPNSKKSHLIIQIQHGNLVYNKKENMYYHKHNESAMGGFRYDFIDTKMNNNELAFLNYISDEAWWTKFVVLLNMDEKDAEFKGLYEECDIHKKIEYMGLNLENLQYQNVKADFNRGI